MQKLALTHLALSSTAELIATWVSYFQVFAPLHASVLGVFGLVIVLRPGHSGQRVELRPSEWGSRGQGVRCGRILRPAELGPPLRIARHFSGQLIRGLPKVSFEILHQWTVFENKFIAFKADTCSSRCTLYVHTGCGKKWQERGFLNDYARIGHFWA